MIYLISPLVLTLWFKTLRIFLELLLGTYASLALWNAVRLLTKVLLVVGDDMAGGLSLKTDVSFGFCPNANWNGEKHEHLPVSFSHSPAELIPVGNLHQCLLISYLTFLRWEGYAV